MPGTVITLPPAAGIDVSTSSNWTPSLVNSIRIATVAERLAMHVCYPPKDDAFEFFNLCLSLARGIDYAVANNEVPDNVQDLPKLLKQVCQRKTLLLQAAIMVLMVSVKSACKTGWFSTEDSVELLTLADEVASSFLSIRDMNTEVSNSLQIISTIMGRFYPRLKMGQTLAFLEVKPGYGTFLTDFHIPKIAKSSAEDKVRLFVVQTDDIETSSCLLSPPQMNFLLNGKGVDRRTNVYLDTGPQLPTVVMHLLKYGTNILQVVGQCSGNYIIAIAYMSVISNPDDPVLQDYVQPEVAVQDQDSELIEGPSRISLNCPISFRRIKTPAKGHSCKHLQCFDFDNFVDINSRRPSWRCPHCNQCVSYVDIRIDQNMAKALKEVGDDVAEVIISSDGSWKPVMESNENSDPPHEMMHSSQQDVLAQQKASSNSNAPLDLLDLTEGDDDMDVSCTIEIQDVKPVLADIPTQSGAEHLTVAPVNTVRVVNQNDGHIEDDFWSRMLLSTYSLEGSGTRSESENFGSAASNSQLQQSQFGYSMVSNEYGTDPSITRQRVSMAVQALPAQAPTSVSQQRLRYNISTVASQASASPSVTDPYNQYYITLERQRQISRSHVNPLQASQLNSSYMNPLQVSQVNSSSLPQPPTQNWHHQSHSFIPSQAAQLNVPPSTPLPTMSPRVSPVVSMEQQNSRQHPILPSSRRVFNVTGQSPNLNRPSQSPQNHNPLGATQSGVDHNAQRATHTAMGRQPPSVPVANLTRPSPSLPKNVDGVRALMENQRVNIAESSQPSIGADGAQMEQNWRPTGRMRGSLQGQAYSAALQQFIFQPAQPVQAARPPTLPSPSLNVLLANSRNAHTSQGVNYPSSEANRTSDSSGVVPELPSAME